MSWTFLHLLTGLFLEFVGPVVFGLAAGLLAALLIWVAFAILDPFTW